MGLETGTYVSELVPANPGSTDNQSQGDDHLRLVKSALQATFPGASKPFYFPTVTAKTANFTVLSSEQNKFFPVNATSGAVQATLPALAAGDAGWSCTIQKVDATASAVTVVPSSGTINGLASVSTLVQFFSYLLYWTGTTWQALHFTPSVESVSSLPWGSISLTATAALTAVDKADIIAGYDSSATANSKWTVEELYKAINTLTEETSIQQSSDFLVVYDASATAARKVKPANAFSVSVPAAATQAEMEAASSTAVSVTPGRAQYHPGVAKVWACVTVTSGVPSLAAGYGVASVTDTGTGRLGITFSTAFSSVNYCVMATIERSTTATASNQDREHVTVRFSGKTTTTVSLECLDGTDGGPVLVDPRSWNIVIFGDQ